MEISSSDLNKVYTVVENCLLGGQFPTNELIAVYLGAKVTDLQPFVESWFKDFGPVMGNLSAIHDTAFATFSRGTTTFPNVGSVPCAIRPTHPSADSESVPFLSKTSAFTAIRKCVEFGCAPTLANVRQVVGRQGSDARLRRCIGSWLSNYSPRFADDVRTARMSILTGSTCSWDWHLESRSREQTQLRQSTH